MSTWKRTGRTRYRSSRPWIKERLILQVEEFQEIFEYTGPDGPMTRRLLRWRDATTEDISKRQRR